jgi:hypothetical protein
VRTEETRLGGLPAAILDLDVRRDGGSVAVCGRPEEVVPGSVPVFSPAKPTHIVFDGSAIPLQVSCRYPLVRAIDDQRALLVNARCRAGERNAWIVRRDGSIEHEFRAGDAVNDVIVCEGHFVIAYFDEASYRLGGVAVLDRTGRREWNYNDSFGGNVVDCYCACDAEGGRILFLGYPDFSVVLLDVVAKQQRKWTAPELVHGASAVTVAGDTAFFFGSHEHRHQLVRWRLGETNADRIGTATGPLRGLRGGRMLSTGLQGHTVLSFDDPAG